MIFKKEDLVDTILLEGAELDKESDRPSKRAFYNQILLAPDLIAVTPQAFSLIVCSDYLRLPEAVEDFVVPSQ